MHSVKRSGALQQPTCHCGKRQTMSHTVDSCPQTKLEGGLQRLHSADDVAIEWLKTYSSNALITRTSNAFENWTSQVYYTERPLLFTNFSICTVYLLTAQTLLDERNKTVVLQNVLTICYTHPVLILRHNQSLALLLKFWLPVWDFHQDWLPVFGVSK